jgi:hypothetical protein
MIQTHTNNATTEHVADIVANHERFAVHQPLGRNKFLRIPNFLRLDVAETLYRELCEAQRYERVDIAGITLQWRGEREVGDAYYGRLLTHDGWQTPDVVYACYRLFESRWFENLLSQLIGYEVRCMRPATPYRLAQGDRICPHDDMSDPRHRAAVVLNLTKDWRREYGGNTVISNVIRVEDLPTPPEVPFQLRRWVLGRSRHVVTPQFNSLTIMRLAHGLAHSVTPIRVNRQRFSIVCMYGTKEEIDDESDL